MAKFSPAADFREMQWLEPRGPWYARKRKGDKWLCKSTKLRNRKLARGRVLEILKEWDVAIEGERIEFFRDGLAKYEDSRQNAAQATRDSIKYAKKHLEPFFGPRRLNDITLNIWEDYVAKRRETDPEVALFNEWKVFLGTMNLMRKQGHRRLELDVPNPDEGRERNETLVPDHELEKWFAHMNPTTRLQGAMIHDLLMRPIEVKRLEPGNVDFTTHKLRNGQTVWGKIRITTKSSKGKKIKAREIPMTQQIYYELKAYMEARRKRCIREYGRANKYVFHARGNPDLPVGDIGKAFEGARQRAGIPTYATPYTIRHTALNTAYRRCLDEFQAAGGTGDIPPSAVMIALMAGHSIQTAMRVYLKLKSIDLTGVLRLAGGVGSRFIVGKSNVGTSGNVQLVASNS